MRRPAPQYVARWSGHDNTEFDPEKLMLVGFITLTWNYLEDGLDQMMLMSLKLPQPFGTEVTSRINGIDGKFEIIKAAAKRNPLFSQEERGMVTSTLGALSTCKTHRDDIIHARVTDPKSDIAIGHPRRGKATEFLFTTDALGAVFKLMSVMCDEVYHSVHFIERFTGYGWEFKPRGDIDPNEQRLSEAFRAAKAPILECQGRRQSLPPLPNFPSEGPDLSATESR